MSECAHGCGYNYKQGFNFVTTAAVAFSVLDYALRKLYPYHTQFHKNCLITRDDGVCSWHPPPAFGTATPRPSVKKLRQAAAARQATGGSEFRQGKFGTIKSRLPTQNYHPVLSCLVNHCCRGLKSSDLIFVS